MREGFSVVSSCSCDASRKQLRGVDAELVLAQRFDFDGFAVHVTGMHFLILGVSAVLMTGLALVLAKSRAGRLWRACSQNIALAQLCGINTDRVLTWTGAAAAGFAAVSGWIIAIAQLCRFVYWLVRLVVRAHMLMRRLAENPGSTLEDVAAQENMGGLMPLA